MTEAPDSSQIVLVEYSEDRQTVHIEFVGTDIPMWVGDTANVEWEGVDRIEGQVIALSVAGGHTRVTIQTR